MTVFLYFSKLLSLSLSLSFYMQFSSGAAKTRGDGAGRSIRQCHHLLQWHCRLHVHVCREYTATGTQQSSNEWQQPTVTHCSVTSQPVYCTPGAPLLHLVLCVNVIGKIGNQNSFTSVTGSVIVTVPNWLSVSVGKPAWNCMTGHCCDAWIVKVEEERHPKKFKSCGHNSIFGRYLGSLGLLSSFTWQGYEMIVVFILFQCLQSAARHTCKNNARIRCNCVTFQLQNTGWLSEITQWYSIVQCQ